MEEVAGYFVKDGGFEELTGERRESFYSGVGS